MDKKQKLFLGFTVIIMTVIFTMVGCELPEDVTFPSEFIGTWKRETQPYTNTLLFITKDTYQISSRSVIWKLTKISGDTYYIENKPNNFTGWEVIVYVNGKLEIERCGDFGEDNCGGTWVKQ